MERLVEWNCKEKNSALPKCINEWGDVVDLETICAQLATIYDIVGEMSLDRLRELVEADRDGRCVVLPKDGMVYFLEESIDGGEKWVGNWPVKDVFLKCGFGIASLSYSIRDIGNKIYLTREAAEAELKGEQNENQA